MISLWTAFTLISYGLQHPLTERVVGVSCFGVIASSDAHQSIAGVVMGSRGIVGGGLCQTAHDVVAVGGAPTRQPVGGLLNVFQAAGVGNIAIDFVGRCCAVFNGAANPVADAVVVIANVAIQAGGIRQAVQPIEIALRVVFERGDIADVIGAGGAADGAECHFEVVFVQQHSMSERGNTEIYGNSVRTRQHESTQATAGNARADI